MTLEELIRTMNSLKDIQGSDGNWNFDPYMHGMYNAMEIFCAIAEEREEVLRDNPKEGYSADKMPKIPEQPIFVTYEGDE